MTRKKNVFVSGQPQILKCHFVCLVYFVVHHSGI